MHLFQAAEQEEGAEQEHGAEQENEVVGENTTKLHSIRLLLLDKLVQFIPNLTNVSGVLAIPFMQVCGLESLLAKCRSVFLFRLFFQVVLMLTSDLDGQDERDKNCIESLLKALVKELEMDKPDTTNICQRSNKREVHLVIMRLLSE